MSGKQPKYVEQSGGAIAGVPQPHLPLSLEAVHQMRECQDGFPFLVHATFCTCSLLLQFCETFLYVAVAYIYIFLHIAVNLLQWVCLGV